MELQQIANSFLNTLKAEVFHSLEAKGMFLDPCEEEVSTFLCSVDCTFVQLMFRHSGIR